MQILWGNIHHDAVTDIEKVTSIHQLVANNEHHSDNDAL